MNNNKWKRDISLFLTSQTISLLGSSLISYAIMWYVTLESKSGTMMTLSIIFGFLPTFFLSPFGGVWADRLNKKKLIIFSDLGIALATLVMAFVFIKGNGNLWIIFLLSALRSAGNAIQSPSVGAFIPSLVPSDQLMRVNGINGTIQSITSLLSPILSGFLLSVTSIGYIMFLDVITAFIAIFIMVFFLKVEEEKKSVDHEQLHYFQDMKAGYTYIKNHNFLRNFFLFIAIFFILIAPSSFLSPLQVTRRFGKEVWRLTSIEVAFSIGMILGGIYISYKGEIKDKIRSFLIGSTVFSLISVLLGLVPNFYVFLILMFILGMGMPFVATNAMTLIQENSHMDYIGRVMGVFSMIFSSMMPLGMLIFGPLADVIPLESIFIFTGIILVILILITYKKKLITLPNRENSHEESKS